MDMNENARMTDVRVADDDHYAAGACNIGPAEIAARRRFGHIALAVTVALAVLLVATAAPRLLRLLVFFPAAAAATGYLQAAFHFCVGFATRGVYNFGPLGTTHAVADDLARARDRRRASQLFVLSAAIGLAAAGALLLI